jgi:hypothetical protein
MRGARIALVAGLTLLAIAIGFTLLRSPLSVAATNKPRGEEEEVIASTRRGTSYCQAGETLPRGTSAIRVSLRAALGPRLRLVVSSGGHPITGGEQASGWTGWVVSAPVRPLPRTVSGVMICVSFQVQHETLVLFGKKTPAAIGAREGQRPLQGRMWIEYLRPGTRSWASLASSIVRNMGFGRADGGVGIVILALALLTAVAALASSLLFVELR